MIKKLLLLFTVITSQAMGGIVNGTPDHILRTLYDTYSFQGDRHNEFVGDDVVILDDGSAWKVHPKDKEKFARWNMGEIVHPRVRTSHYWFKREHKFELFNHNNFQTVRAMLVRYPYNTLIVSAIENHEVSRVLKYRPLLDNYGKTVVDSNGDVIMEEYWVINYVTCIILNNGTGWTVDSNLNKFQVGQFVYLSANNTSDNFKYFLISGSEREAAWAYANWIL